MKKDLTSITLVIDRSGSMSSIRDDAEGGINSFIKEQADLPGEALLTLVQFDSDYDVVVSAKPIGSVSPYRLVPRGCTALLDAVGRAINETGSKLSKMKEKDRPEKVVLVIVTDGFENASKEFTKAQIKSMIEHQQSKYDWQFTFLGSDISTFSEAKSLGVALDSTLYFRPTNVRAVWTMGSSNISSYRLGATTSVAYTDEQRAKAVSGD